MDAVGQFDHLAVAATMIGFVGSVLRLRRRRISAAAGSIVWPRLSRCSASACRITGSAWCWSSFLVTLGWLPPAMGAGPGGSDGRARAGNICNTDPACGHDVGHPDGHHRPHHARAGRRYPLTGLRTQALAAKGLMTGSSCACRAQCRTDRALGDGPAARLSARRLDPDRNRVLLARHRLPAEWRHLQRDLPILQGTILVLAMFFVLLNLIVDVLQSALDPRIQRS
jgi:peptide/nickel transport system permease protein